MVQNIPGFLCTALGPGMVSSHGAAPSQFEHTVFLVMWQEPETHAFTTMVDEYQRERL